jgi:hypothetical protein
LLIIKIEIKVELFSLPKHNKLNIIYIIRDLTAMEEIAASAHQPSSRWLPLPLWTSQPMERELSSL